jgi:hypothetical protein
MMDIGVGDDVNCGWSWDISAEELQGFLTFLSECAALTWAELKGQTVGGRRGHKKHHAQKVDTLPTKAQQRLAAHADESIDELFRLRYGSRKRIWGLRDRAVFHLIWLDLEHQVYPTEPG